MADLGLQWETLQHKKILDIGARNGRFAHEVKKRKIDIYALEPHPHQWTRFGNTYFDEQNFVQGEGLNLPFQDNTFDFIVSRASVHLIVQHVHDIPKLFEEVTRVLQPGGEFRFGPGILEDISEMQWTSLFNYYRQIDSNTINQTVYDEMRMIESQIPQLNNELSIPEKITILQKMMLDIFQEFSLPVSINSGNPLRDHYFNFFFSLTKDHASNLKL